MVYVEPIPIPISSDLFDALLSIPSVSQVPEYTMLPLINRSLDLRISAIAQLGPLATPQSIEVTLTKAIQLSKELDIWFETIPASYRVSNLVSKIILPNFYRYHQVFLQDILIRAYYRSQQLSEEASTFSHEIAQVLSKAQRMVNEICMSMPYTFDETDPHFFKPPTSGKEVMNHVTFS